MKNLNARAWLALAVLDVVMGLLLFVPAGTVHYWQAASLPGSTMSVRGSRWQEIKAPQRIPGEKYFLTGIVRGQRVVSFRKFFAMKLDVGLQDLAPSPHPRHL
jgi:hypothetical protein